MGEMGEKDEKAKGKLQKKVKKKKRKRENSEENEIINTGTTSTIIEAKPWNDWNTIAKSLGPPARVSKFLKLMGANRKPVIESHSKEHERSLKNNL